MRPGSTILCLPSCTAMPQAAPSCAIMHHSPSIEQHRASRAYCYPSPVLMQAAPPPCAHATSMHTASSHAPPVHKASSHAPPVHAPPPAASHPHSAPLRPPFPSNHQHPKHKNTPPHPTPLLHRPPAAPRPPALTAPAAACRQVVGAARAGAAAGCQQAAQPAGPAAAFRVRCSCCCCCCLEMLLSFGCFQVLRPHLLGLRSRLMASSHPATRSLATRRRRKSASSAPMADQGRVPVGVWSK